MDNEDIKTTLEKFGLSEKEIASYLVILEHGKIEIRILTDEADISLRYAYEITEQLEQRGLVVVDSHLNPTTVRPISPSQSISYLRNELSTLETELHSLFNNYSSDRQFEVIKSKKTIINQFQKNIKGAKDEVIISIPKNILADVIDYLSDAFERGVFILLLVTGTNEEPAVIRKGATVMRISEKELPPLLVVDNRIGILSTVSMFQSINSGDQSVKISQPKMIPVLVSAFFGNYWQVGTEVFIRQPSDLPQDYSSFRHAVFDATCQLKMGRCLYAKVKAKPMLSNEGIETISGNVERTDQTLIEPLSDSSIIKNSLYIKSGNDLFSIGGQGTFVEDFESTFVQLMW